MQKFDRMVVETNGMDQCRSKADRRKIKKAV